MSGSKRKCESALDEITDLLDEIAELEDQKEDKEKDLREARKKQRNAEKDSTKKTEASGLCFDCLKRILIASRPSTGQIIGNVANMFIGAGTSVLGYDAGRKAQTDVNMLRIQQGYEAQADYYSLMGARAGFPYMARGLDGLTRANTPQGGWSCSPTVNPYGHVYDQQYGQGFKMRYY